MDSTDVISYINSVLNSNESDKVKLDSIDNIINDYFNDFIEQEEEE